MRTLLLFIFLFFTVSLFSQSNSVKSQKILATVKYKGLYSFGDSPEKGAGQVTIYPESDSTVLFFIDICRGEPDLSLGQLYARLKIVNGEGLYYVHDSIENCKWQVTILNNIFTITTIGKAYDCGFGYAVGANHQYQQKDHLKHEYFIDGHRKKIYFSKTSPENYYK
jgi:hypothetical protein